MRSDDITLISGKRRSGKSVYLKNHLQKLQRSFVRYLIWDYQWEYEPAHHEAKIIYEARQIPLYFNASIPFLIYRPRVKDLEHFEEFCYYASKLSNMVIVIEEVEKFATSYIMPKNLKEIVDNGRHRGLGLICTCRRIMRIAGDIPFNANYIVLFRQHRPQDLKYLSEYVGEGVYSLPKLPDHYYLVYDDSTNELSTHEPVQE